MMGLSDAALLGSWYAMYAIIFGITSLIIGGNKGERVSYDGFATILSASSRSAAVMTRTNIFKTSDFILIWFVFFMFLMSSAAVSCCF